MWNYECNKYDWFATHEEKKLHLIKHQLTKPNIYEAIYFVQLTHLFYQKVEKFKIKK